MAMKISGINPAVFFKKMVREGARYLGYDTTIDPLDADYWRKDYSFFGGLTNPFDNYSFVDGNGREHTTSLAELCLFNEGEFNEGRNELLTIIREISEGSNPLVSRDNYAGALRSETPPNFRVMDNRWNNPNGWFDFPHRSDVYTPDLMNYPGVPIPKTEIFRGWKPTRNLLDSSHISDEQYIALERRIVEAIQKMCVGSNIHPGLCVVLFMAFSPGPNSQDYAQCDAIAREIIRNNRANLESHGAIGLNNPRAFWAQTLDADERDNALYAQSLSDWTGIPLERRTNSYFCKFDRAFVLPDISGAPSNSRIHENLTNEVLTSIRYRSPFARNSQGVRIYADEVGNMLQLINTAQIVLDYPPQVFLHAGMSFHNALIHMSFSQLGGNENIISDYNRIWGYEVNARATLPAGRAGFRVPIYSDITPENIGTLALASGGTTLQIGAQSGNPYAAGAGAVLLAAGKLMQSMDSPGYGEILARARDIEYLRQNGSHELSSTIYRRFKARQVLSCQPVMRFS